MKKVFIFGYYGFKNLGDEAILSSIIKTLKENEPSVKIYALSYNVNHTEKIHGIIGVSRNHIKDIIYAIKNADLVISGGGSLLQDVTSSRSLLYYLGIIGISKLFKKPVLFFSNGFGPVKRKFNQYLTSKIVNKVDKIIVRDKQSKLDMEEIGINIPIEVTTDATFVLESVHKERVKKIFRDEMIPLDKPLIGISVRPWYVKENFIENMAKFSDYVIDKGVNVLFIPMQPAKDMEISKKIMNKMKKEAFILKREYKPDEILGIIKSLDILVGMRLHALIFAAIGTVPMIGIEYDPKIAAFLESVEQKNIGKVENLDVLNLCMAFDYLWEHKNHKTLALMDKVMKLKKNVNKNKEVLKEMIQ
ncbi:polysaccharide pyruvyl transferase CsaB [Crassaminicella thermophila]|uniref:Polysaccharide pyruvyl transferase CsaB n=1 Tax=Crassaminicella thermophila TaxID=2599308 RepID=A0A5C0SA56_CRATE|nr:polysaccharide pyruvyl transferase CsaB [Crassaminicella thermophila]QEK11453.1 polysaccharide pyruvyl transferase CsaB [Crassaminicella thermophila]